MPDTIGARIRAAREAADLTQMQLAAAVGSSQDHISRVERDGHEPTLALLRRIAAATGVTLGSLVGE